MKVVDIALKDLLRSLRSAFLLVMMFVAPLLITGLIYLAFGGLIGSGGALTLPRLTVLVANLDQPNPALGFKGGELLSQHLAGPELAQLLDARAAEGEAAARSAVELRQADAAVIIPADFSAATEEPGRQANVMLYYHPDSSIAARVLKVVVTDFVDGFAGAKIAVHVASRQLEAENLSLSGQAAQVIARAYVTWLQSVAPAGVAPADQPAANPSLGQPVLSARAPATADQAPDTSANGATLFLGPVMAGMMVFFMFFTGAATAQSILYEDQEGTLARLFTTPTRRTAILGGKFLAVVVTLVLQAIVLLAAAALVFKIQWGHAPSVALLTIGIVVAASGFGILLMSFVRSTRQAGPVMGVVITLTGMLGGLMSTGNPSQGPAFEKLTLALPQGWAMHGWRLALAGANPNQLLVPFLVLIGSGAVLFAIGTLLFRRRFE